VCRVGNKKSFCGHHIERSQFNIYSSRGEEGGVGGGGGGSLILARFYKGSVAV
jgi:hypothetical protein